MEIDVRVDVKKATRELSRIQRRVVPLATAKALTFTAERAQKAVTAMIPQVFSSPTPFTRRAVRIESATVNKLRSAVALKDVQDNYLTVQTDLRTSAQRKKKRNEIKLLGSYWVIGRDARTNRFGNLTRATYKQMIAAVRSGSSRGRFFITGNKPRRIIRKRVSRKRVIPWLVEVSNAPTYGRRLPMNRITQQMVRTQFRRLFDKAVKRELVRVGAS